MVISMEEERIIATSMGIRVVCQEMEICMNCIERILETVGQDWQGEAERAYERKILAVRHQYEKILSFFQRYAEELETVVKDYEEWEEKNASLIQNV